MITSEEQKGRFFPLRRDEDEIRRTLGEVLSFASVQQPAEEGMPFGRPVFEALDYMLGLGARFGFRTRNLEGYAGHIEWGEGEILGILTHLDVVPAGSDWTVPPFAATFRDGRIYGRGILDDKGPAVAVLYAMKQLREDGFVPKKRIRLIMGCNEETGWKCMQYYMAHEEMPAVGFSPDGDFPAIHCEKGVLNVRLTFRGISPEILELSGGERVNMVPDRARAVILREGRRTELCEEGVSAHGSQPQKGVSAVFRLLRKLAGTDPVIDLLNARITDTFYGEHCGLALSDEKSGRLTLNLGLIRKEGDDLCVGLDIRYPVSFRKEEILERLKAFGAELEVTGSHDSLYVDPQSELVQTLLGSYRRVTGRAGESIAIGGATYARILRNGVAFGPVFPDEEATIHRADECTTEENFFRLCDIYRDAIEHLAR